MSKLISETGHLSFNIDNFKNDYFDKKTGKKRNNLSEEDEKIYKSCYENMISKIAEIGLTFSEIKLFLNYSEPIHKEFITNVHYYIKDSFSFDDSASNSKKTDHDVLISSGRKVLKQAWEEAKKDVSIYNQIPE